MKQSKPWIVVGALCACIALVGLIAGGDGAPQESPKRTLVGMDRLFQSPKKRTKSRVRMGGGSGGGGLSAAATMSKLQTLLRKLRRATSPVIRESLVAEARASKDLLGPSLVKLMTDERTNPFLVEAIFLASALDLREALEAIRGLAEHGDPAVRAASIRGADILEPWHPEAIALLLTDSSEEPLIAALEVAGRQRTRPVGAIVPLLGHPKQRVRTAALNAIPILTPGQQLDALLALVRRSDGKTAQSAALALARSGLPAGSEKLLFELLDRENWLTRKAALQALASKRTPLSRSDKIMAIIRNPKTTNRECTFALVALELTRTVPRNQLRAILPDLHPVMRLLASRCLVTVGDAAAIPALIGLLDTKKGKNVDEEDRDCAKKGARTVLRELAGRDLGPDKGPWLAWAADFQLRPVKLSSKPPTFW